MQCIRIFFPHIKSHFFFDYSYFLTIEFSLVFSLFSISSSSKKVLKFIIWNSESRSGRRKYCIRSLREISLKSKVFSTKSCHTPHSSRFCLIVSIHILTFNVHIHRGRIGLHESSLFTYNLSRASCRYHICPLWEKILRVINRAMAT